MGKEDVKKLSSQRTINMDDEIIKNYDQAGVGVTVSKE